MKFEIERRANVSYEQFAKEYLYPLKPVIITDMMKDWKALKEWTPEFFKKNFASMTFNLEEKPKGGYKANGDGANTVEYTMDRFIDRVFPRPTKILHPICGIRSLQSVSVPEAGHRTAPGIFSAQLAARSLHGEIRRRSFESGGGSRALHRRKRRSVPGTAL